MNPRPGLAARVFAAWTGPAASFRAERAAGGGEPRLVALAFGAALFLTLGRAGAEVLSPAIAPGEARYAWFAATVLIGFSFGVLALYGVAAAARLICRALGGGGDWRGGRLALFWSGLAAGPLAVLAHLGGAALGAPAAGGAAGGLIWGLLYGPMLAAAEGFRPRTVLAVFAILALMSLWLAYA